MDSDKKMIRVLNRGIINTSRGRTLGPIYAPYREYVHQIWTMITQDRAKVEELLPDGTFIPLTVQNFDKNNYVKVDVATNTPIVDKPVEKDATPEPENVEVKDEKEDIVEEETSVEETSEEESTENDQQNNGHRRGRRNRRNRNNQNNTPDVESV